MKNEKLKNSILKGLLMAAAVAAALPMPHAFAAGGDLGASVTQLTGTELTNIPDLIAICFYIGGTAFMGSGALKLKAYSENPQQTPLGQGIGRISIGAFMLALPFVAESVISTFAFNGAKAGFTQFSTVN